MRTRRLNQSYTITERPAPRRPHTRESQVTPPLTKGGQGRPAPTVADASTFGGVCLIAVGVVVLVAVLPRVVALVEWWLA